MGVRILLDTHALLWALMEPDRFSSRARAMLQDPSNTVVVSSIAAWEIATKHRLGKLPEAELVVRAFPDHLKRLQAEELPVRISHALLAGAFPNPHRDPFDRMLAAQCLIEGLPLMTVDPVFQDFSVPVLW